MTSLSVTHSCSFLSLCYTNSWFTPCWCGGVRAGGEEVFLGCWWVWMMVWRWTNWQQQYIAYGVLLSVERMSSGQHVAHLIASPQDVLQEFSPRIGAGWLSPRLYLSLSAGCRAEPHFADPGQRVGGGGKEWWVRGHNGNAYWQLKEFQSHSEIY